jgi:hypothetical protein
MTDDQGDRIMKQQAIIAGLRESILAALVLLQYESREAAELRLIEALPDNLSRPLLDARKKK